jgi:hypothetical protein
VQIRVGQGGGEVVLWDGRVWGVCRDERHSCVVWSVEAPGGVSVIMIAALVPVELLGRRG